jgi:hypothetical protein
MPPKSAHAPARIPEFDRNIAQMDSEEALRFLDVVRAQVANGKLSSKKLADLLGEYASEPRAQATLDIPDELMQILASKLNSSDLANLMVTSKEVKRQTESVNRANATASPLLYLPPKLLSKVLSKVKMEELSALKRTSHFASEQVDKALIKSNPCVLSDLARRILTLANWVHKKRVGQVTITLNGSDKSIEFPVFTKYSNSYQVYAGDSIRLGTVPNRAVSYINLPAKLDEDTIRNFALYLAANVSGYVSRGSTMFKLAVTGGTESYYWNFGEPLNIPDKIRKNSDYVKIITAYAKTINKCYYPAAPHIASPTSPLAS